MNKEQIASETAFQYVCSIAEQKGEKHSYYDEELDSDRFNDKYQVIFDEMWDFIANKLENID
jgi:hypothetical protein